MQADEGHGKHKARTGQYEEKQERSRGAPLPGKEKRKRGRGIESSCTSRTQPLADSWPRVIIMMIMIIIAAIICLCV